MVPMFSIARGFMGRLLVRRVLANRVLYQQKYSEKSRLSNAASDI